MLNEQPQRSKRVREDRRFDKTQLKAAGHGRTVNRDYGSHALRWNFVVNEVNKPMEEALGFWAAGLIDGEGCFDIRVSREGRNSLQFIFQLGLRADDEETIELLRNLLKVGKISDQQNERITNAKPIKMLTVCSLEDCLVLRDFFLDAPLRSKKRFDFAVWAEALTAFEVHKKTNYQLTDELMSKMENYQKELREGRKFPSTALPPRKDYIKDTFLRWGWAARQIKQGESILDVGCGQDQPLLYVLASRKQTVPDVYVGVDLNRIVKKSACRWADIYDEFDFVNNGRWLIDNEKGYTPFDKAVCFEVIEHMAPEDGIKLLETLHYCLRQGGILFLSTPVFDGYRAANHIHEYTIPELSATIQNSGFRVQRRIGTFASKPEIRPVLDEHERAVYERLEEWFGGDVLSTIFASLHPDQSRNNLWVCERV